MSRFFNRNKKTTIAELEEYYSNQERRKNSTGKAWLMAFLSLLVTVAVLALLFFAGRWLYRTITSDDSSTTTDVVDAGDVDLPTFDSDTLGQGNTNTDTEENANQDNQGVVSDEAASTDESNEDRVNDSAVDGTNNPAVGEVPNTGAGEALLAVPATAAVAGYFVARRRFLKNN